MSKYTQSAKGQECEVRYPFICNRNPATTVFAHLPGAGMATKHLDIHGAYACSECHNLTDGRIKIPTDITALYRFTPENLIRLWFYEAMVRTQIAMVKNGTLTL